MVELLANTPLKGIAPKTVGQITLSEVDLGHLTSVAPFKGARDVVSDRMKAAHGVTFPEPNRATATSDARAIWFGYDLALFIGPALDQSLQDHAAMTDQSDAWVCMTIKGDGVEDVLARLVPVNLQSGVFPPGHTVRTLVQHMNASITRIDEEEFLVLVFRSMAKTLLHDLETAMESIAARG